MDEDQITRTIRTAWGLSEGPTRGPRPELTHEQIVDAAIAIAGDGGLAAVTMSRVAQALGFSAMSLYRYVGNKDELLALMADKAGSSMALPGEPDADWRAGLTLLAREAMTTYRAHPWLLDMPTSMLNLVLPGGVAVADAWLRAMRVIPLDPDEKLAILLAFTVNLRAYATLARDVTDGAEVFTPATGEVLAQVVTAERFPDLAPVMAGGMYTQPEAAEEMDEDLGYALDRLFDGITLRIERTTGDSSRAAEGEAT